MKCRMVILVMVLLVVSLSSAYAGNTTRIGTAGAQELLIPYGSRGSAMGGAVLSTTKGVEAMYWNPAGLASLEGTEAMFTHIPYIADINVNYVGVATTIEGFGTIGGGAKVVDIGDIEETTQEDDEGTGRIFSPSLTVINVSYARILTANVQFGMSAMFIHEDIFEAQASGLAFDAGFIYNPRWEGLSIGVTIKNYGSEMQFEGIGANRTIDNYQFSPIGAKFDLPSSINFGMAYDLMNKDLHLASVSGNFQSNNYSQDAWYGGAEYMYDEKYALRAGYRYSDQDNFIYGFSFGAGLTVPLKSTSLSFEYTWNETDVFNDNQYFTVRANF